jgi:hypothetical protein
MSKFNKPSEGTKTTNVAGGQAFKQSPEMELVSLLLTSFANQQFYRSYKDTFVRLKELLTVCNPKFAAQSAVYARNKFDMRSISHVAASELAKHISGEQWAKDFYAAVVNRPDDMMEILSYYKANNNTKSTLVLPGSMKKGFALAFDKFDGYQLAKWRGEGKDFKLVDIVNLVRPVPSEKNAGAIQSLIKDELINTDTWEAKLSKAGQDAENDDEKADLKGKAWASMILEKKLGYMALLKNLRNIIEDAPDVVNDAIESLTNENFIKSSRVLPFRFVTAYNEIVKMAQGGKDVRNVLMGLNKAIDISLSNVPKFDGDTLVVLDVSMSMTQNACEYDKNKTPALIGALFTAMLIKANNADLITFDGVARYVNVNPMDSTITITNSLMFEGESTDFNSIFPVANKKYDRVIILSDMQGWVGNKAPVSSYQDWKKRTGSDPFLYSFDLTNYGTLQFPENKILCLAGFSNEIFNIMSLLEKDKNALVNEVKKIKF